MIKFDTNELTRFIQDTLKKTEENKPQYTYFSQKESLDNILLLADKNPQTFNSQEIGRLHVSYFNSSMILESKNKEFNTPLNYLAKCLDEKYSDFTLTYVF